MGLVYKIKYHEYVLKNDLPKLSNTEKNRIKKSIEEKLLIDPTLYGAPLRQSLKGYRKLRVGDYRVVYKIAYKEVKVLIIAHRKNVYMQVPLR